MHLFSSRNEGFGWMELIVAILFFIAAYFAFSNPAETLQTITIIFGIVAILRGTLAIVDYFRGRNETAVQGNLTFQLIIGIIGVLVGLAFLFFSGLGTAVLSYAFAIWFLVDSVEGLFRSSRYRERSNGLYWTALILNILGLVVGVLLILNPLTALFTFSYLIAFAFLYFGILNLFLAFA